MMMMADTWTDDQLHVGLRRGNSWCKDLSLGLDISIRLC